jgi:hypothetical protein
MAQTKKQRRRKHRGTQGGSIERRARSGRPRNRAEARARARQTAVDRRQIAPTWRSATIRGIVAAVAFYLVLVLALGRSQGQALGFAAFMLVFYIPLGYYTDNFFYRRRMNQAAAEAARRKAERRAGKSG